MRSEFFVSILVTGALSAGCASRRHMSEGYGVSVRQALSAQVVRREPPDAAAVPVGLEPDEARIVYENYRSSLSAKDAKKAGPAPSGLIVVEEPEHEIRRLAK